jgi:hypothetical protein
LFWRKMRLPGDSAMLENKVACMVSGFWSLVPFRFQVSGTCCVLRAARYASRGAQRGFNSSSSASSSSFRNRNTHVRSLLLRLLLRLTEPSNP